MRIIRINWFLPVILSLLITSCKETPIEPEIPEPGRRDYTWTVDTLDPGTGDRSLTERIYGETPDNIWAVGEGKGISGLWHYDGKKWEKEENSDMAGVVNILGFSKNDIWICGYNSFWHYTGQNWERYNNIVLPDCMSTYYLGMAGTGPDNIYAVGCGVANDNKTTIPSVAHFNGTEWRLIDINYMPNESFINIKLEKSTGNYYILSSAVIGNSQIFRVYLFDGNTIKKIFSSNKTTTINCINDECFFTIGKKIYVYLDNSMILWKDFSGMNYAGYLWGRSEGDIFTMNYGALGHYDGRDMVDIFKTDLWVRNGLLFENEVFFCCIHPERNISYIIHGRLNK